MNINIEDMARKSLGITKHEMENGVLDHEFEFTMQETGKIWEWVKYVERKPVPHSSLAMMDSYLGFKFKDWNELKSFIENKILDEVFEIKERKIQ